jgi:hypothetical protein
MNFWERLIWILKEFWVGVGWVKDKINMTVLCIVGNI